MASIDEIICREVNPFDRESLVPGNFWQEKQDAALAVNSIHQEEINQIEKGLNLVKKDSFSRTILLVGDTGSGKSYLLARLKRSFNDRAFFAYIDPWSDNSNMWRYTLRQTVDSLIYKPEGKKESQLLLWLKGLSAFRSQGLAKKILGERGLFVKNLCDTYPNGMYNAKQFFGVLYDLTNPDLYYLACNWLRGEDLDEEDLKALKVQKSINSEDAAKGILGNFGRISADNQPIVLCFDQLDSLPKENGFINFQSLFNLNTTIHNQKYVFRNYLIIISVITSTWKDNKVNIQPADLAPERINIITSLKRINMQQAEALWQMRLHYIHGKVDRKHHSSLYPLYREQLKINFPGGKTNPREALSIGHKLYQTAKHGICKITPPPPPPPVAEFKLLWQKEYKKVQQKVTKITILDAPKLIQMLQKVLAAFKVTQIQPKLLTGKYNLYSFSYLQPKTKENIGIVWTEDAHMNTFCNVMKASQKIVDKKQCQKLYLIRFANVGHSKLKGNQIYRQIFFNSPHSHIKPNVTSIIHLATYYELFKLAENNDLMIGEKNISIQELQDLVNESTVLNKCTLLNDLGIIEISDETGNSEDNKIDRTEVKEYLFNLVKTHQILGKKTLIEKAASNFPDLKEAQIEEAIQELYRDKKIKFLNSDNNSQAQLICLVPQENPA